MKLKLRKAELKLIENVEKHVNPIIEQFPINDIVAGSPLVSVASNQDTIKAAASDIESTKKFNLKEYENIFNYFKQEKLNLYEIEEQNSLQDNEFSIKKQRLFCDFGSAVVQVAKQMRREKNRETIKVDTNLLSHAPYVAGGSKKRKAKAKEEGHISFDKAGLRNMTYQNSTGELLTCFDAKTLAGIFAMWAEQGHAERVKFKEYQLLDVLNMGKGGKQYDLIRDSLQKIKNTEVIFKEATRQTKDGEKVKVVIDSFKFITAYQTIEQKDANGKLISRELSFELSPHLRESFKEGYFTLISLAVFDELDSEAAKAIYLMISAIHGMDNREEYILGDGSLQIPLQIVYDTLFLENTKAKNKIVVDNACEELKHIDVIASYKLVPEGRKATFLIIEPSTWLKSVLSNNNISDAITSNNTLQLENIPSIVK